MTKNTKTKVWDIRTRYTHSAFRPYALAIGQFTLAWNGLQDMLAFLFCGLMGGGYVNPYLAAWQEVKSDRQQRAMLLAVAKTNIGGMEELTHNKYLASLEFLVGEANKIEDRRNDIIHAPLWLQRLSRDKYQILPSSGLGNKKARNLLQYKDLLREIRWCRDACIILLDYAIKLDRVMTDARVPLPDKPTLPNRGDSKKKTLHPQAQPAKPPNPPPPSQE